MHVFKVFYRYQEGTATDFQEESQAKDSLRNYL